jgi:hypothetical protein
VSDPKPPDPESEFKEASLELENTHQHPAHEVCIVCVGISAMNTAHRRCVERAKMKMMEKAAKEADLVARAAFPHHPAVQGAAEGIAARIRRLPLSEDEHDS